MNFDEILYSTDGEIGTLTLNNPDKASQTFGFPELHPGQAPPEFFL